MGRVTSKSSGGVEPTEVFRILQPHSPVVVHDCPSFGQSLFLGLRCARGRPADRLHIKSLVFELRPGRRLDPNASWLNSVRARLREEYRHQVTLDDLAGAEGRHPAHLARAFKGRWGMTTGDFLRRVRVAAAVRLLQETDAPLSVVAVEAGFSDQSHMGRWLRRYVGLTPGNVRASAGDPPSRSATPRADLPG